MIPLILSLVKSRAVDISKNFFTERFEKHLEQAAREVVESPSLKIFKRHTDVVPRDMA